MYRILVTSIALFIAFQAQAVEGPLVDIDAGRVRGVALDGSAAAFRGIPFAAPVDGEGRWRPPGPVTAWPGERDATRFGPDCPQPLRDNRKPWAQNEDCLSLNVVTPDLGGKGLPVLVSIHGGAFFVGSGRDLADHDLSPLVRAGVVLVSPNYRLGRLGFFAHPELGREATARGDKVANYWLMDQIAALEWVQQNIHRFGGDPSNITLLGCSAGGSSVNALMAAPAAKGLFHKACARSGGGFFNATRSLQVAEAQGQAFARRSGRSDDAAALAALRALDADAILALESGPPDFGAVVDGVVLTEPTSAAFAHGRIADAPYLSGSTSDEAGVFGLMGFDRKVLADRFGVDVDAQRVEYGEDLDDAELLRQVQTDLIFTSAAMGMTALAASSGRAAYGYHFDYVRTQDLGRLKGASHCADMPFVLGTLVDPDEDEARVSSLMQAQLLAFIRSGNPNVDGGNAWPRFSNGQRTPLLISRDGIQAQSGFRDAQLQPWYRQWERMSGETFPR